MREVGAVDMNYKKIISSRALRIKIMQALSFLPDSMVIKLQYKIKTGHTLHLKKPVRYTEKLQWYKLNYKNPVLKDCVDKYNVRKYVEDHTLKNILNECYGVFNSPEEIDFGSLPEKFVCKDTLGGGSTSVIVVDKNNVNLAELKKTMQKWVDEPTDKKHPGREWPYDNQKHRIIIEKFLEQDNGDLADFKFFCFNGRVKCFYVRTDYAKSHDSGKMAFFNREKELLNGVGMDYCNAATEVPELVPEIEQMILYAEKLSEDFPHVRVDFYDVNGRVIFGELTFYNASGYMKFIPDEFDKELGKEFILPRKDEK